MTDPIDIHPEATAWQAENVGRTNAEIVKRHGWKVGDVIIGHERWRNGGWVDNALRILWIGREAVMFRSVAVRIWTLPYWSEQAGETASWTLDLRPWRLATEAEIAAITGVNDHE